MCSHQLVTCDVCGSSGMERSTVKLRGLHDDVSTAGLLAYLHSMRMPAEAARVVVDDETGGRLSIDWWALAPELVCVSCAAPSSRQGTGVQTWRRTHLHLTHATVTRQASQVRRDS